VKIRSVDLPQKGFFGLTILIFFDCLDAQFIKDVSQNNI